MGREHRRVVRLRLEKGLKVVMGSMGSEVRYDMATRDISNNGFFLDFEKPGRFPFTAASIMEVWMELEPNVTIFFNGKMARVVYPEDKEALRTGPGIAVRIVQIESAQEQKLVEFINKRLVETGQSGEPEDAHDAHGAHSDDDAPKKAS